jgi:hypothetical protein
MIGNVRIGDTVMVSPGSKVFMRVMHISRGFAVDFSTA